MKQKFMEKALDPKWIVINENGEPLDPQKENLVQKVPVNKTTFPYKSYVWVNNESIKRLVQNGITEVELGLLILMSTYLSPFYNTCDKEDHTPHTAASLSNKLGQKERSVKRKLNRLIKLQALAYEKFPGYKRKKKVYFINPNVIKLGKEFDPVLNNYFNAIIVEDVEKIPLDDFFSNKSK